jgi:APA family basic amino acid/polyamine antiporter
MVVSQVVGVGIFLTPATMMRTLGSPRAALAMWAVMGTLSAAGALCYAELSTRFPRAGGSYLYLREAYGPRSAFVYGWMALLVMDPGLTAALGIGFAQYLLATLGASPDLTPSVAIAAIIAFGLLTLMGIGTSARAMQWTAAAKLSIVVILVGAALVRLGAGDFTAQAVASPPLTSSGLAASLVAAFFAFGGWWDLGRMGEEVESPRRTMPRALVGGLALVSAMYALVSVAYMLGTSGPVSGTDEAFVLRVGASLFGRTAGYLLSGMVVVAVSGSLAAVLLGSPRVYVAMARDGIFPERLARFNAFRGTVPASTIVQILLACGLVLLGTFNDILGYFVPCAVFFLGLSATAVLVLPRPDTDADVFRTPLHPLPIALFLVMVVSVLALFFRRPATTDASRRARCGVWRPSVVAGHLAQVARLYTSVPHRTHQPQRIEHGSSTVVVSGRGCEPHSSANSGRRRGAEPGDGSDLGRAAQLLLD